MALDSMSGDAVGLHHKCVLVGVMQQEQSRCVTRSSTDAF